MRIHRLFIANEAFLAGVTRSCGRDGFPGISDPGQDKQWTGFRAGDITALRIGCVASQRVRPDPAVRRTVVITALRNRPAVTWKRHSGTASGNARGSGRPGATETGGGSGES